MTANRRAEVEGQVNGCFSGVELPSGIDHGTIDYYVGRGREIRSQWWRATLSALGRRMFRLPWGVVRVLIAAARHSRAHSNPAASSPRTRSRRRTHSSR